MSLFVRPKGRIDKWAVHWGCQRILECVGNVTVETVVFIGVSSVVEAAAATTDTDHRPHEPCSTHTLMLCFLIAFTKNWTISYRIGVGSCMRSRWKPRSTRRHVRALDCPNWPIGRKINVDNKGENISFFFLENWKKTLFFGKVAVSALWDLHQICWALFTGIYSKFNNM